VGAVFDQYKNQALDDPQRSVGEWKKQTLEASVDRREAQCHPANVGLQSQPTRHGIYSSLSLLAPINSDAGANKHLSKISNVNPAFIDLLDRIAFWGN
jgi:hypothetical protein